MAIPIYKVDYVGAAELAIKYLLQYPPNKPRIFRAMQQTNCVTFSEKPDSALSFIIKPPSGIIILTPGNDSSNKWNHAT